MSPSPTFLNDACPAVSPTIFLNDASSSDEEEEQRCEEEGNVLGYYMFLLSQIIEKEILPTPL
jgi:hypothetical protein